MDCDRAWGKRARARNGRGAGNLAGAALVFAAL